MAVFLDGDVIAYRSVVMASDDFDGENLFDLRNAISNAKHMIRSWTNKARAGKPVVCLSPRDGSNFRKVLAGTYKQGRPDKPEGYWDLVDWIEDNYRVERIDGLEADDVMAIMATHPDAAKSVVVTIDKDLRTVPCRLLNPDKDRRPMLIKRRAADYNWMVQTLVGDPTDGYKGCPRVGKKSAPQILGSKFDMESMWSRVVRAFKDKKMSEEDALMNAWLSRIVRYEDYEAGLNAVLLWTPDGAIPFSLDNCKGVC